MPAAQVAECAAPGKGDAPWVADQNGAGGAVLLTDDKRRAGGPRAAQHPFGIGGHAQAAWPPGEVTQGQPRNLDRVVQRYELQQLHGNAAGLMAEAAVTKAMPRFIVAAVAQRLGGGAEQRQAVFVTDIQGFAWRVADGVVGPGRELVFPAVVGPGVAAAFGRDLKAELRIGDHVDPGCRGVAPGVQAHHVLAAIQIETALAVGKLQRAWRRCVEYRQGLRAVVAGACRDGAGAGRDTCQLFGTGATMRHQQHPGDGLQAFAVFTAEQVGTQHEYRALRQFGGKAWA